MLSVLDALNNSFTLGTEENDSIYVIDPSHKVNTI
jgi:hypothetical protein